VGRLGQAELETIASGPPGRRWLLVEAPFDGLGDGFMVATGELRARGFGVVIAHPERSPGILQGHAEALGREIERAACCRSTSGR
jgi:protein-tyrosine phosphatase